MTCTHCGPVAPRSEAHAQHMCLMFDILSTLEVADSLNAAAQNFAKPLIKPSLQVRYIFCLLLPMQSGFCPALKHHVRVTREF